MKGHGAAQVCDARGAPGIHARSGRRSFNLFFQVFFGAVHFSAFFSRKTSCLGVEFATDFYIQDDSNQSKRCSKERIANLKKNIEPYGAVGIFKITTASMESNMALPPKLKMKLEIIAACAAAALALIGCGGGADAGGAGGQAPVVAANQWVSQGQVIGACCFYSSLVFTDGGIRIYSNSDSSGKAGDLDVYEGTFEAGVGASKKALSISVPQDAYIRTSAIAKYAGRYYAMLYTGTGYPPADGFSPSWADSDDGLNFTWRGAVSPYPRGFSSGQALTVDDRGVFRAWIDSVGGTLREMSSTDGLHWIDQGDMWPASLPAGQAVFPAAARSPRGTMLSVADASPSKKIRVLWKCDGQKEWTVLEEDSVIHQSYKGTSLSWDGEKFHAYGNALHWTRPEPSCPRQ